MAKFTLQITKALSADDMVLTINPANETEALDLIRDFKDSADDGWRMIPQRDGAVADEENISSYTLRSVDAIDEEGNPITVTAKAELHTSTENGGSNVQYDTLAEAITAIDALNASDGFLLIDEFQGNSLIVYDKPKLWKDEEINGQYRVNGHGREDFDRI